MNPLVLLGAAVAFLWWTGKTQADAQPVQHLPLDSSGNPLVETFNNVPLPPKTKPTTLTIQQAIDEGRLAELASAPIQGISPPADSDMPPYVYDQRAGTSFGAFESPAEF